MSRSVRDAPRPERRPAVVTPDLCRRFLDRQGREWYVWGDICVQPWVADEYARMKRLKNPELAAEYWYRVAGFASSERLGALLRFATLPHAADTDYE